MYGIITSSLRASVGPKYDREREGSAPPTRVEITILSRPGGQPQPRFAGMNTAGKSALRCSVARRATATTQLGTTELLYRMLRSTAAPEDDRHLDALGIRVLPCLRSSAATKGDRHLRVVLVLIDCLGVAILGPRRVTVTIGGVATCHAQTRLRSTVTPEVDRHRPASTRPSTAALL